MPLDLGEPDFVIVIVPGEDPLLTMRFTLEETPCPKVQLSAVNFPFLTPISAPLLEELLEKVQEEILTSAEAP